jgi:hypothetical protein
MTDLFLIYESVTSSASNVRWLALHSWTLDFSWLNHWTLFNWTKLPNDGSFYNFGQTEDKSPCLTVPLLFCFLCLNIAVGTIAQQWIIPWLFAAEGTCLPNCCLAMVIFQLVVMETCVSELLVSNGLFRLSGVVSQYIHYITYNTVHAYILWQICSKHQAMAPEKTRC